MRELLILSFENIIRSSDNKTLFLYKKKYLFQYHCWLRIPMMSLMVINFFLNSRLPVIRCRRGNRLKYFSKEKNLNRKDIEFSGELPIFEFSPLRKLIGTCNQVVNFFVHVESFLVILILKKRTFFGLVSHIQNYFRKF